MATLAITMVLVVWSDAVEMLVWLLFTIAFFLSLSLSYSLSLTHTHTHTRYSMLWDCNAKSMPNLHGKYLIQFLPNKHK